MFVVEGALDNGSVVRLVRDVVDRRSYYTWQPPSHCWHVFKTESAALRALARHEGPMHNTPPRADIIDISEL